ncbi:uncharacterized protein LOC125776153 [Bactrocera dorsalis]|uniref:Uncharacterized protein LOC125776153 n=1 Tax=Bactrocera dorsalis TaxID=27457 RepID=A0ABM3J187_BACDO|nr:uncharacterized protein LOC125776153 [Bactrocera dorsalis]
MLCKQRRTTATASHRTNACAANVPDAATSHQVNAATTVHTTDRNAMAVSAKARKAQTAMRRSIAAHVSTTRRASWAAASQRTSLAAMPCPVGRIRSSETSTSEDSTVLWRSPVIELSSENEDTLSENKKAELTFPAGPNGVCLYQADLQSLEDGSWLTDTVIDAYAKHLEAEFGPRGTVLSPFVVWQLNQPGRRSESFRRIHRWIRNVDIFGQRVVLAPHNTEHHWYLLALSNRELTHHVTDTVCYHQHQIWTADSWMRGKVTHATTAWREFLQWEYKERGGEGEFEYRKLLLDVPQQENTDDCGIYVLETIERVMRYIGRGEGALGCISEPFTAKLAAEKRAQYWPPSDDTKPHPRPSLKYQHHHLRK